MGYQIRIAPEVERWLAEIRDHDPAAADRIDQAVAALQAGGASAGPPLVVPVDDPPRSRRPASIPGAHPGPRRGGWPAPLRGRSASGPPRWRLARTGSRSALPGLDAAYQRQLEMLTPVRRAVADVATKRKQLEIQIGQLERQVGGLSDQRHEVTEAVQRDNGEEVQARRDAAERQLADLRLRYADMQAREDRVTVASQRLQAKVDAFRTGMEATKAAYAAAEEAAETAWAEVTGDASTGTGGKGSAVRGADAGAQRAGSVAGDDTDAGACGPARPAPWLSELRPGAPESADARILFTVEPSGTAVLLAAAVESDRLEAWYTEAIAHCRIRYRREQRSAR